MDPKDSHPGGFDSPPRRPEQENQPSRPPWWRRLFDLLQTTGIFHPDEWPVRRLLAIALVLAALVTAMAVMRHGIAHVRENQVGVMVNNWRGTLQLKDRVGYHIFLPYLARFYMLDKTIQRLDMVWGQAPASAGGDVKIKTSDGSNVSLDVTLTYKLIPEKAVTVLRRSGPAQRFGELWVESFARYACLSAFGRLSTEEMYDAVKRDEQAQAALRALNGMLQSHGIEVIALIPGEFRFYREYEQVIQEKKLADQQVEERQAEARALLQDQERQLIETRKRAEAQLASVEGECANRIIQANAEADKKRREAEGYYRGTLLMADAALYSASNEALGKRATLYAEAEGLEALRQAMSGEGGLSMVSLEYAKRLGAVRFSGTPISREPSVRQFSVQPDEAAAAQRSSGPTAAPPQPPGQAPRRSP